MATTVLTFADIALQLETATAQLRVLSVLPETQRNGMVLTAVEEVKKSVIEAKAQLDIMQQQIKKQESEAQSLRDTTNDRLLAVEAAWVQC